MTPRPLRISTEALSDFVEAYEVALERDGEADLADFLPAPSHALHLPVLRELVCIDLERAYAAGRSVRLQDYEREFPRLFVDLNSLQAITYEDYRLRLQVGEAVEPMEYARRFGVDVATWPRAQEEWRRESLGTAAVAEAANETPTDVRAVTPHAHLFAYTRQPNPDVLAAPACEPPAPPPSVRIDTSASGRCNPELFSALYQDDPRTAFSFAEAATRLPAVGTRFLGFQLLEELGRGAFARVYLARQGELADRPVVLKVSADVGRESRLLAQLQHANIVPIYSRHRAGPLEAVCMPYLGVTTLADLIHRFERQTGVPTHGRGLVTTLRESRSTRRSARSPATDSAAAPVEPSATPGVARPVLLQQEHGSTVVLDMLEGMSYVHAVLWVGARLADGLTHAHSRGVIHRDLKPANVLITDEGQPMLLDFNLAEDTKVTTSATAALIGGTLPYMAPEQLRAYQERKRLSDPRMDVYSLGVILYELLAGRHPFPAREGDVQKLLPEMIADRQVEPPVLSLSNPAVSPAVQAILNRCLAPDPRGRYSDIHSLREDLDRQLNDQPLLHTPEPSLRERFSKWRRRHPRLSSASAVVTLAGVLLLAVSIAYIAVAGELARHETREAYRRLQGRTADVRVLLNPRVNGAAQAERGLAEARNLLAEPLALTLVNGSRDPELRRLTALDREQLRADLGDLLLLCARAGLERAKAVQSEEVRQSGLMEALGWNEQATRCYRAESVPRTLVQQRAELLDLLGQTEEAKAWQERAELRALTSPEDHYLLGRDLLVASKPREAVRHLEKATRGDPRHFFAWYHLAHCYDLFHQNERVQSCLNVCASLRPDFPSVYFNRGLTYLRQQDFVRAAEDFEKAIGLAIDADETHFDLAEAYCNRGLAKQGQGRLAEALNDFNRALAQDAAPTRIWFTRARAKERLGDTAGAAADRAEGMRREPRDAADWVSRGLARMNGDPAGALADLDMALRVNARYALALQNKAALLAQRLRRTEDAIAALDQWIKLEPDSPTAWVNRGVLRARLGQRAAAHADAAQALHRSPDAPVLFQAACVYAQTSKAHAEDRTEACRLLLLALGRDHGFNLLETDEDLAPIRDTPEFSRVRETARTMRRP